MGKYFFFGRVYPNPVTLEPRPEDTDQRTASDDVQVYDRWTPEALAQLDLRGLPVKYQHATSHTGRLMPNSVIGHICHNQVSEDMGCLWVVGYVDTETGSSNQRALANFARRELQSGRLTGLSIAHRIRQLFNPGTGQFRTELEPLEISVVDEPDYANCRIVCHGSAEEMGLEFANRLQQHRSEGVTDAPAEPVDGVIPDLAVTLQELHEKIKILTRKNSLDRAKDTITEDEPAARTVQQTLKAKQENMSSTSAEQKTPAEVPVPESVPEKREAPVAPTEQAKSEEPVAKRAAPAESESSIADRIQSIRDTEQVLKSLTPEAVDKMSKAELFRALIKIGGHAVAATPAVDAVERDRAKQLEEAIAKVNSLRDSVVEAVASDSSKEQAEVLREYFENFVKQNQSEPEKLNQFVQVNEAIAAHAGSGFWRQRAEQTQREMAELQKQLQHQHEIGVYKRELGQLSSALDGMPRTYQRSTPAPTPSTSSVTVTSISQQQSTSTPATQETPALRSLWDDESFLRGFEARAYSDATPMINRAITSAAPSRR